MADRTGELATANAQLTREVAERQQAEDALRRAGAYNRSLIEASLDPLVTIGPDGKITDVNAATERATGCTRAALIGTDFSDYFTDPGKARLGYQQVFRDGSIRDYALEILHRDGHVTSVLYSASVYSDEGGEVIGVFAAARDITERKRAEEKVRRLNEGLEQRVAERTVQLRRTNQQLEKEIAERRQAEEALRETRDYLEELFNHANAPIIVWDREFRIVRFNHAFEHLTGYLAGEVMGKALEILFPEASREVSLREIDRTSRGEYWDSVEIPILRKDGNIRIALWNSANIYAEDGQTLLASMAHGNDITERKQSEQEIERLYDDLQRRSVELEDANKELEAFSYSVSHDLRAPLRAIDGFSRILVEEHGSDLPPGAQRYLNLVRGNTSQMGKLVDDLLAFSRLSRQTLRSDRVNPVDLVHQCLEELQTEREGRRVEIVVGDLSPCMADPSLLKQVWINLLSNALKFTRRREVARIEVGCLVTAEGSGQKAPVYFVRDNGVGFDMQYAHKLFGVFQRLHRPEDYDGTGVGLAIVQRILHRHGGRVWAEAEPDKGATFYFTLGD